MSLFSLNRPVHHARKRHQIRPRLDALEDRRLLSITEFPTPTPNAEPIGITAGPDGNLWFTELDANNIGEISPTTHAVTEFAVPSANSQPDGITAGPDGNLWFTEFANGVGGNSSVGKIGEINPTTHVITEFPTPTEPSRPRYITAGPDGNLWFTEQAANQIGMINPATHVITEFPNPGKWPLGGALPYSITAGPDGNIWFTEGAAGMIGNINPTTHAIAQFPISTNFGGNPSGITAGPDGNLWFSDNLNGQSIGMINPTTHAITEFTLPTGYSATFLTTGPDGNIWFTDSGAGRIGYINPTTFAITEYPIPYTGSKPALITTGPDGNLWFPDYGTSAIDVDTLNSDQFVVTQQPPASITAGAGFGLTVQADNSSGNLDPSFNGTVTVALQNNPGGATLGGTLTVTASGGVATFSGLTLTKASSGYTLVVSNSSVNSATTSAITVTPAAATQLVITKQPPASVKMNSSFGLQASIEDAYGNVVTTPSGSVSVAFASNPTGAKLGGTLTVTASSGVASFTNLTINKTGSGYTLQVSSSGLTSATSNPIKVTSSGYTATTLLAPAVSPATDLSLAPLVLDSPDLWDGLGFKKHSRRV